MLRSLVIRRRALAYAAAWVSVLATVGLVAGCGRELATPPVNPPLLADLPPTAPATPTTVTPTTVQTSPPPTSSTSTPSAETVTVAAVPRPSPSTSSTSARTTQKATGKATPQATPKATPKGTPQATTTTPKPTSKPSPKPTPKPAPKPTSPPQPPVTTPVSDPSWVACSAQLGGVQVSVGARQRTVTVVNGSGGSTAVVSFWLRTNTPCGFANAFTDSGGRIGYGGMTNGATRVQGNGTTPTGTYTMTEAFGIKASPGTALSYRRVGTGDFWVEDNNSAYYNTYRNESQGGFDATLPLSDPNGSERLLSFPGQYDYVIVVNFNRAPDALRPYRGAGIFIHVRGSGATAGCVAGSSGEMVTMLRTMRAGDTVTIVP